jgi:hypothetical protein
MELRLDWDFIEVDDRCAFTRDCSFGMAFTVIVFSRGRGRGCGCIDIRRFSCVHMWRGVAWRRRIIVKL